MPPFHLFHKGPNIFMLCHCQLYLLTKYIDLKIEDTHTQYTPRIRNCMTFNLYIFLGWAQVDYVLLKSMCRISY